MLIHAPGLYAQIPMEEYLALEALSSGVCHTLLTRSPAHARYHQTHPGIATEAMDVGTAAHRCLLEGHEQGIRVVEAADWRTKAAREARDEARQMGAIPLLAEDMAHVRAMGESARAYLAHSEIAGVFAQGQPEQTLLWREDQVACKARPDWVSDTRHTVMHYKTTRGSANPDAFVGRMVEMGYDVAAAWYARGMQRVCGVVPSRFLTVFLVQETEPPYACALVGLAPSLMEIAAVKVEYALKVWAACLDDQHWPAYPSKICYAEARSWQITQAAEKALQWQDEEAYQRIIELA